MTATSVSPVPVAPKPETINEYIAAIAEPLGSIAATLRAKFDEGLPGTDATLWHGHPVWLKDGVPVAGFKAYANFVTLLLWQGQRIADSSGKLDASGSAEMGSVRLRAADDVDPPLFDDWLRQLRGLIAS
jgi:hypothetical protein